MMMFLILIFADWNEVHTTRGFVWLLLTQAELSRAYLHESMFY